MGPSELCLEIVQEVRVCALAEQRFLIVGSKGLLNLFGLVCEIEHHGFVLAWIGAVEPRERLYSIDSTEFFVYIHCMQQRLIEARLEFVGNDQDAIRVLFEDLGGLCLRKAVHVRFCIVYASVTHGSREGDQRFVWIAMFFQIAIYCMLVAHGVQARAGHNHRFGLAIDEMGHLPGKVFDHDGYLFGDSLLMSIDK